MLCPLLILKGVSVYSYMIRKEFLQPDYKYENPYSGTFTVIMKEKHTDYSTTG
jgi:hypothetical protein